MTGIETVDNDEELWTLNDGIQDCILHFLNRLQRGACVF